MCGGFPPRSLKAELAERIVLRGVAEQATGLFQRQTRIAVIGNPVHHRILHPFDTNTAIQQIGGVAMAEKSAHVAGAKLFAPALEW